MHVVQVLPGINPTGKTNDRCHEFQFERRDSFLTQGFAILRPHK